MKILLLLTFFVAFSLCIPADDSSDLSVDELQAKFLSWVGQHNKTYGHDEVHYRFKIWRDNFNFVLEHNARTDVSFTVGMNRFADLTIEEFVETYTGAQQFVELTSEEKPAAQHHTIMTLPDTVDWRLSNVVTPVKDQGQCGSCWAFSTTGTAEGAWAIKNGTLVSLSEQQLLDCNTANSGCNGGWPYKALDYLKTTPAYTEASFPYQAHKTHCTTGVKGAQVTGYYQLPAGSEPDLQSATALIGPVSVCIDASHQSFQLYTSGVYDEPACNPNYLDHAVLSVGYGFDSTVGKAYWLVKNSWGTNWGEQGYIRMLRNANNQCGIASAAVYALV